MFQVNLLHLEKYSSMSVLINAYTSCPSSDRNLMLSKVCDKVGVVISSRVHEYLFPVVVEPKISLKLKI